MVKVAWLAAAHAATHRSRGQPTRWLKATHWARKESPRLVGAGERPLRRSGAPLPNVAHSAAFDHSGVDIHPGCKLGRGVTIDHATGVTLGETCVVGVRVRVTLTPTLTLTLTPTLTLTLTLTPYQARPAWWATTSTSCMTSPSAPQARLRVTPNPNPDPDPDPDPDPNPSL